MVTPWVMYTVYVMGAGLDVENCIYYISHSRQTKHYSAFAPVYIKYVFVFLNSGNIQVIQYTSQ